MLRGMTTLTLSLCLAAMAAPAPAITEQEAHSIAVDAYVYFYSLLSMDITRKQFTNVQPGKDNFKGPMNTFVNVPEYPPADFKGVVGLVEMKASDFEGAHGETVHCCCLVASSCGGLLIACRACWLGAS